MVLLLAAAWLSTPVVLDSAGAVAIAPLATGSAGEIAVSGTDGAIAVVAAGTSGEVARVAPQPAPDPVIGGEFGSPFEPFAVEARLFSRLPFEPSDIAAIAMLSPAATDGGTLGRSHPSIAGGTGFENRWFVDGFEVTDPGVSSFGPWSSKYGPTGWSLPLTWVDRVYVTDAAQDPARGGAGGGAIDVMLPSRGDRLTAGVSYALRPGFAESTRRNPPGSGLTAGSHALEDGIVHASGPIVRDRLWFVAGAGFGADSRNYTVREGWALEPYGEETVRREHLPYVAKLAWAPVHGQEVEVLWLGDSGGSNPGPQSPDDLLETSALQYSAIRFASEMEGLRWQGFFGSSTEVEASVSRSVTSFARLIRDSADRHQLFRDFRDGSSGGGIGSYERARRGETLRGGVVARRTVDGAGLHHLRGGAGVESATLRVFLDRSGKTVGSFFDESGVQHDYTTGLTYMILEADDASVVYRVIRGAYSSPISRAGSQTSWAFVEDRWAPVPRLSIAAALRVEQSTLHGGEPRATRHAFPAALSPRASIEWAALRDGRVVAGLEAGRVVMPVPLRLAELAMSGRSEVVQADYASSNFGASNQIPDGTAPVDGDTTHVRTAQRSGLPVLGGTEQPYYDEIAAAVRWDVRPQWRVDARLVHRQLGRVVETVSYYSTLEEVALDPNPDEANVIANPGRDLDSRCTQPGCWRDPRRDYDALHLSVRGAIGKLDLLGTWRVSRLFGNYEGVWQTDSARPAGTDAFDFPNGSPMATDGNAGALPLDRTHVMQLAGAFDAPGNVSLGAIAWLRSGRARTEWVGHPVYQTPTQPHEGWGRGGREPGSASLDLRASWTHPLSFFHVTAAIDVLNVFDSQTVERTAPWRETSPGNSDPSFGDPIEYAPPRSVRFTLRGTY